MVRRAAVPQSSWAGAGYRRRAVGVGVGVGAVVTGAGRDGGGDGQHGETGRRVRGSMYPGSAAVPWLAAPRALRPGLGGAPRALIAKVFQEHAAKSQGMKLEAFEGRTRQAGVSWPPAKRRRRPSQRSSARTRRTAFADQTPAVLAPDGGQ